MSLTSVNRPEFIPSFSVKVEALQEKERIMFIAVRLAFPEEGQVFLYTFIQIADALSQFLIETFGNHFFVMARHLVQHPLVEMDHVVQYKFFVFQPFRCYDKASCARVKLSLATSFLFTNYK